MRVDKLNPEQIESISILKDQSAVAIYGDKAKEGVMLIATKNSAKARQREGGDHYTDDDVFFIDGKAVSKNEYIETRNSNKGKTFASEGRMDGKGRRFEIKTK